MAPTAFQRSLPLLLGLALACSASPSAAIDGPASRPSPRATVHVSLAAAGVGDEARCGVSQQRLFFAYHPGPSGYDVTLIIEHYTGEGSYADLTTDMDSTSGVKVWVHSVGASDVHLVRGIGTAGAIRVESVTPDGIVGSVDVDVRDATRSAQSDPPVRLVGRWACRPTAASSTPALVPTPPSR